MCRPTAAPGDDGHHRATTTTTTVGERRPRSEEEEEQSRKKKQRNQAESSSSSSPPEEKSKSKLCVLDLDHTILHMLKASEMPAGNEGFAEDVATFEHEGAAYSVAVRVGTTSFVRALRAAGVTVVIATCNLVADKVMAALAARCDVFADLDCHVIESRDKGAKSLALLGVDKANRRVVVVDDSPSAWRAADQDVVLPAKRYDARLLAAAIEQDDDDLDDLLDQELGYLLRVRDDLLAFFTAHQRGDDATNDDDNKKGASSSEQMAAASSSSASSSDTHRRNDDGRPTEAPFKSAGAGVRAPSSGFGPAAAAQHRPPMMPQSSSSVLAAHNHRNSNSGSKKGGVVAAARPAIRVVSKNSSQAVSVGDPGRLGGFHTTIGDDDVAAAEPPRKRSKSHAPAFSNSSVDNAAFDTLPSHVSQSRSFNNGAFHGGPGAFRGGNGAPGAPRGPSAPPGGQHAASLHLASVSSSTSNVHRGPRPGALGLGFNSHDPRKPPALGGGPSAPLRGGAGHYGPAAAPSGFGGLRERPPPPPQTATSPAAILSQL